MVRFFAVFVYISVNVYTPIFRITSMTLGQLYDCPRAIDVILKDMYNREVLNTINTIEEEPYVWFLGSTVRHGG